MQVPDIQTAPQTAALFEALVARRADFRQSSTAERRARLDRLQAALLARRSALKEALMRDFHKPPEDTDLSEIVPVLTEIRHTRYHLHAWMKPEKVPTPTTLFGTRSEIRHEARGVALIIAPWNYPVTLTLGPLVSAIAAGCPVVIKPSEYTPHTNAVVGDLIEDAFPDGSVAWAEGDYRVASELLELPFDHIFFTGSPRVGRIVMRAAAEHLTSVTLELGGKSPAIVDRSANLEQAAARISAGKWLNAGQTCIAPDYVLVHKDAQEELLLHLSREIERRFGATAADRRQSSAWAYLAHDAHFEHVESLLSDAVAAGATVVTGGRMDAGERYAAPTLLTDLPGDARILNEEIFGPLLPVVPYSERDEAIAFIEARPPPLALYVFSEDDAATQAVIDGTRAGGTVVNDTMLHFIHPDLPFGGIGQSGFGKSSGRYGFQAFSNARPVLRQELRRSPLSVIKPPYSGLVRRAIDGLIGLLSRF